MGTKVSSPHSILTMNNITQIYGYLLGTLDHLISAYCLEYDISKEEALKTYVIPLLSSEFQKRGSPILSEMEFEHISKSLKDIELHTDVKDILAEYTKAIRKIMYSN